MRDELLTYYERELTFIRRSAAEFAEKYPKVAGRLQLERDKCDDPHVERLIEAVAFLAARVHLKIDDEFPEITESLLQVLYPHFLAPVPSMSIVQFTLDPQLGKLSTGYPIERHRPLYSRPSQDARCRFRTCYPVTLWPLAVESVKVHSGFVDASGRQADGAIVIRLETQGEATFGEIDLDELRMCLAGEAQVAHRLYEAIFGHCRQVELRDPAHAARSPIVLSPNALGDVGFAPDEGLLPYSSRSFLGYRLIQEYFHFPEKFLFVDVRELRHLQRAKFGRQADLVLLFDAPIPRDMALEPHHFSLGCTPIVNLFGQPAEPIMLDHAHAEYRVIPDLRHERSMEVYSVDAVSSIRPETGEVAEYQPFYSVKHSASSRAKPAFWHATRRASLRKDDLGTDVYLTLVDLGFKPTNPAVDVLSVSTTCTNRDLPALLPFGEPDGDFHIEGAAAVRFATCLTKPTRTVRPPLRHGAQWRLISHLALNYLSPAGDGGGSSPEVLQEILRVYDFADSQVIQQQIAGLVGVSSRPVLRRIRTEAGSGFARGVEATLQFDESKYVGSGVYLFASILERFLALYVSINSFTETVAASRQRGVLKRWPPRSGQQSLV